jgi:1-phosphofructokinase family hexose kinase
MILAAGLSPAWQQILRFDSFVAGEVNRAVESHWCASGKVLNVAVALNHLGASGKALAVVGGWAGAEVRREFEQAGIAARWIETAAATRVCTTIVDGGNGATTELVENASAITERERRCFVEAYREEARSAAVVVLTGSLPAGTPNEFYRELMACTPGRVVLDARGPELFDALARQPFLVKPNRQELARTVGRSLATEADVTTAMRELNDRGAEWVLVTDGGNAAHVSTAGCLYRIAPPAREIVNPIGSGDCLAAGIAYGIAVGADPMDAIRIGFAAAAENVGRLLPARIDRERVATVARSILIDTP